MMYCPGWMCEIKDNLMIVAHQNTQLLHQACFGMYRNTRKTRTGSTERNTVTKIVKRTAISRKIATKIVTGIAKRTATSRKIATKIVTSIVTKNVKKTGTSRKIGTKTATRIARNLTASVETVTLSRPDAAPVLPPVTSLDAAAVQAPPRRRYYALSSFVLELPEIPLLKAATT